MTTVNQRLDELTPQAGELASLVPPAIGRGSTAAAGMDPVDRLSALMDRIERVEAAVEAFEYIAGCMVFWRAVTERAFREGQESVQPKAARPGARTADRSGLHLIR